MALVKLQDNILVWRTAIFFNLNQFALELDKESKIGRRWWRRRRRERRRRKKEWRNQIHCSILDTNAGERFKCFIKLCWFFLNLFIPWFLKSLVALKKCGFDVAVRYFLAERKLKSDNIMKKQFNLEKFFLLYSN